jgi:hypothetical protein
MHDIESFLSIQTQAQLNPNFTFEKQERLLRWISGSGATPDEINAVYKRFFDPEVPIVAQENIVIGPTVSYNKTDRKLLVRVTSLDTHEKKEFTISLQNENVRVNQIEV